MNFEPGTLNSFEHAHLIPQLIPVVLDQGIDARYIPSGHLVYVHDGTLMAAPFDLQGLRVTGTPVVIVKGLMQALRTGSISVGDTGAGQFSVSDTGALVYVPGAPVPDLRMSLVWVSRNGTVTPTTLPPGPYGGPRLSPDAKRVLLFGNQRILIHEGGDQHGQRHPGGTPHLFVRRSR